MTASGPVLLISSNSSGRGGGERYLVFLAEALKSIGVAVHVLLSSDPYMNEWARELEEAGADVTRLPLRGLAQRPLRFIHALLDRSQRETIAKFCRELGPAAILVNQQYDEDGLDYLAGALEADIAPVSGVIHMPMTEGKHRRPLGRLRGAVLRRWYRRHPYTKVFSSEGGLREFEGYYTNAGASAHVINSAYPFSRVAPDASMLSPELRDGRPNIGFVGQFVPQKNLGLLVDAWLALRASGSDSRLILVGDGPLRSELENRLAGVPASEWRITGWGDIYRSYLGVLSVYAMSSDFEGLPLALIEAVGEGIPTAVTDFNGASDVADRADWVTVDRERSVRSFSRALASALELGRVPITDARVRRFRAHFSSERMAGDYARVLGVAGDEHIPPAYGA